MTQHPDDDQLSGEPAPASPTGYGPSLFTKPNRADTPPPAAQWGQAGYTTPTYANPPPGPPSHDPGQMRQEQRQWAMIAHLGGVLAIWPVIPLIPALVILTVYLSKDAYVRDQAREAVNFQIVVLIAWIGARIIASLPLFPNLVPLVWIFSLVFAVLAAVATGKGLRYRYPLTYRFLS